MFVGPGRRRHTARDHSIHLLHFRAERPHKRAVHLSSDQWIRRFPALRGWHDIIRLVVTNCICDHVWDLLYRFPDDVQIVGGIIAHEPRCIVRRALRSQRDLRRRLRPHAILPRLADIARPLAALPYHVRRYRFRRGTGDPVPIRYANLPEDRALCRWYDMRYFG